ncbi:hypothetical protein QO034_05780 [Sedimentitalea sp. JM2-8]|uniref:Uncharacterized protein n=1 Tax=Sedimentitalea xiamensis TaxID=3050037 RepID=A0ABT7FBX2_9RHOB|nr:hypothetical protein [Sedimentitalea xiamensis]MDK3072613.1 hypothetical protein [Sedimentitalea xiamensis]
MTDKAAQLAEIIKEIEEVDTCIADLEADARRDPKTNAARHNKFACKTMRRYRVRLVDERDQLLSGLSEA